MFVLPAAATSCAASLAASCACWSAGALGRSIAARSARLAYVLFFSASLLLAWVLRLGAEPIVRHLPWIARAVGPHPPAAFFGQQAVYRVSLASVLFFSGLASVTSGARFKGDWADKTAQHGAWGAKLACWLLLTLGCFFLPVGVLGVYGFFARIGSALFLCVQILMLLDFVCELNDAWVDAANERGDERLLWGLLALSGACYAGAAAFVGVSLYFFNPSSAVGGGAAPQDCSFNVAFIVAAPLGGIAATALALSGVARRGSLFPSAALTLYASYCTYSAMVSEPHGYACNSLGKRIDAASATGMFLAVAATLCSVVYSALRVGSNASLLGLGPEAASSYEEDEGGTAGGGATPLLVSRGGGGGGGGRGSRYGYSYGDEDSHLTSAGLDGVAPAGARALPGDEDNGGGSVIAGAATSSSALPARPVTYSYPFFHCVFVLASAHFAMLYTGYGSGAAERALVDVGWPSVGVKLACAWVSLLAYCWTLVAPVLFPDRDF